MHMRGAGIDFEVVISATKQAHEQQRMKLRGGAGGGGGLARPVPTACIIWAVKP
jgi:hypothetical protein